MQDLDQLYTDLLNIVTKEAPFKPETALILGSGAGGFADIIDITKSIDISSLPGYPASTVEGHKGRILFAELDGKKIIIFQGRLHFYEGYGLNQCVLPVHIAHKLGCRNLIITNAAGGVNRLFAPGDLMLVESFNAIFLKKQLSQFFGRDAEKIQGKFRNIASDRLNAAAEKAALETKVHLKNGVYFYNTGPTYESPAEVRMVSLFGGDAVGMSSVYEAYYGASLGMEICCISTITNYAAGLSDKKLSHEEVQETADIVSEKFNKLIRKLIDLI